MKINKFDGTIVALLILSIFSCLTFAFAQQQLLFKQIPDEIRRTKQFQRQEWLRQPRAYPFDTLSIHTYHQERIKAINQQQRNENEWVLNNQLMNLPNWRCLGPVGVRDWNQIYSGRVRGLAVHPDDPDIVYIGAASGGLWKSKDGGTTWMDLNEDFSSNTFGAIAIDPNNPDVIYAGTGEVMSGMIFNIYDGRGLFKSSDGGNSWTQITDGFGLITQFAAIAVSPHNSNIVFAALGGGYYYTVANNLGIWRSTDAGLTWTRTLSIDVPGNGAYDVAVHPTDSNLVYAALGGSDKHGCYISEDAGLTWRQSNNGLPSYTTPSKITRMQISLAPSLPSTIYALVYHSGSGDNFKTKAFKSIDGGNNWNQIAAGYYFGSPGSDQGFYDLCIAVHPDDPNKIFVGNIMYNWSIDGETFAQNNKGMHFDFHSIKFAPSNHNIMYIGCDGGVYRSADGGNTWNHRNNGLSTLQLYGMASHPFIKNKLIGGSQDNGGFKTSDYGATPWLQFAGGDVTGCFYDQVNPDVIYTASYHSTMMKSSDGGTTLSPFQRYFDRPLEKTFLIHPNNNQCLYAAYEKKLIRSLDGGNSWTPITGELTTWWFETMAQSHVNPNIMLLATMGVQNSIPQVMISTDEGYNWNEVTANIPGTPRWISRVVIHPTVENTIFIVRSGYGSGKIYRSTNLGNTWEDITNDLPDIPHSDLFIDPANPSLYFVANDFGVYGSQDAGKSWARLGNGMPVVVATDLDYFNYNGERLLRVATYGRGAFETDLNQISDWTAPHITLTAPMPGIKIMAGAADTIRWLASDNVAILAIGIQYSIDNGTTWLPFLAVAPIANELIWKTPLINSRFCWIRAQAQDAEGNRGSDSVGPFTINRPPAIRKPAATTILEDEPFTLKVLVEHVDPGDTITYFDNCSFLEINQNSGVISFTPTNEQVGKHLIELGVSDGVDTDTTQFYLTVINVNDAPEPFQLVNPPNLAIIDTLNPTLQWTASKDIDVGDSLYYRLWLATDSLFSQLIREENLTGTNLFIDSGLVNNQQYFWQVLAIDRDSVVTACSKSFSFKTSAIATGIEVSSDILPDEFLLFQNRPNPFNPITSISYTVAKTSHVKLTVYNTLGQVVVVLVNGFQTRGSYSVIWNAQHQPSGLYICRFEADGFSASKKMFLQK